jgi:hypothetical protein
MTTQSLPLWELTPFTFEELRVYLDPEDCVELLNAVLRLDGSVSGALEAELFDLQYVQWDQEGNPLGGWFRPSILDPWLRARGRMHDANCACVHCSTYEGFRVLYEN